MFIYSDSCFIDLPTSHYSQQRVLDGIQVAGAMSQQQYNENPVAIPTNSEGAAGDAREKLQKLLCHQQSSRKGSRSGMVVLVLDELDSLQTGLRIPFFA